MPKLSKQGRDDALKKSSKARVANYLSMVSVSGHVKWNQEIGFGMPYTST